jgi:hypothetical protein
MSPSQQRRALTHRLVEEALAECRARADEDRLASRIEEEADISGLRAHNLATDAVAARHIALLRLHLRDEEWMTALRERACERLEAQW